MYNNKQKLMCLYNAFYQCNNNADKIAFIKTQQKLNQFKINWINLLAIYANICVKSICIFSFALSMLTNIKGQYGKIPSKI